MSLQDAFNSINKSGWNAKKDSVSNTYEGLLQANMTRLCTTLLTRHIHQGMNA